MISIWTWRFFIAFNFKWLNCFFGFRLLVNIIMFLQVKAKFYRLICSSNKAQISGFRFSTTSIKLRQHPEPISKRIAIPWQNRVVYFFDLSGIKFPKLNKYKASILRSDKIWAGNEKWQRDLFLGKSEISKASLIPSFWAKIGAEEQRWSFWNLEFDTLLSNSPSAGKPFDLSNNFW